MSDGPWFRHDADAARDGGVMRILAEYGPAGYGVYWLLAELMFSEGGRLRMADIPVYSHHLHFEQLEKFVQDLLGWKLYHSDGTWFWSERTLREVRTRQESIERMSARGRKGAESRWGKSDGTSMLEPSRKDSGSHGSGSAQAVLADGTDRPTEPTNHERDTAGQEDGAGRAESLSPSLQALPEEQRARLEVAAARFVDGVARNHPRDPTVTQDRVARLVEAEGVLLELLQVPWSLDQLERIVTCATSHRTAKFSWAGNVRTAQQLAEKAAKIWATIEGGWKPTLGQPPAAKERVCPSCETTLVGTQASCGSCGLDCDRWDDPKEVEACRRLFRSRSNGHAREPTR